MKIHGVVVLSNHLHYLLSPRSGSQLSRFMQYTQSNIAKEASDLYGWTGPFWARRFGLISVSDEDAAQIDRLRYLLTNGVKENLVARSRDWPGVQSTRSLTEGAELEGVWYDRTALYELRRRSHRSHRGHRGRRGRRATLEDVAERETVVLSPLPCWADLPAAEARERAVALVEAIDRCEAERRRSEGVGVAGARAVCRRHPHSAPADSPRSPARRFHAASREALDDLREAYREFAARFREASELLRQGVRAPPFPPGSFPPGLPFVPHEAPG